MINLNRLLFVTHNQNINWIPKPVAFVAKRLQQSTPYFYTSYVGR